MTQAKIEKPARLDLADLPRDKTRCLGNLRQQLCDAVNYCRQYPDKLDVLDEVMTATLKAVRTHKAYSKQQATLVANAE